MVKNIRKDKYSCSCCGSLPNPSIYTFQKTSNIEERFSYKFENGLLKLPIEKMAIFRCCEGEHHVPYHRSKEEYLESIKEIILFHIGEKWVDNHLYNQTTNNK